MLLITSSEPSNFIFCLSHWNSNTQAVFCMLRFRKGATIQHEKKITWTNSIRCIDVKSKNNIFYYRFVNTFSFSFSSPRSRSFFVSLVFIWPLRRSKHTADLLLRTKHEDQCAEMGFGALTVPHNANAQPVCVNLLCIFLSRQFLNSSRALVFTKSSIRAVNGVPRTARLISFWNGEYPMYEIYDSQAHKMKKYGKFESSSSWWQYWWCSCDLSNENIVSNSKHIFSDIIKEEQAFSLGEHKA